MAEMQNPTAGDGRVCELVQAGASNSSQPTKSLREIQALQLSSRFALNLPLAAGRGGQVMNHQPKMLSEGYESYLRIIAGAPPDKAETVFPQYAPRALDCALKIGITKGDAVERVRIAGLAAGLTDSVMDQHWNHAVEFATAEKKPIPTENRFPRLNVRSSEDFVATKFAARENVLAPILRAQALIMIAAYRGIGKTHFAMSCGGAIASGGKFLKWEAPVAREVLYIDGEMPASDLQERLRSLPYECAGRLRVLSMDDQELGVSLNLSRPEDQAKIEAVIGNAEVLIFDNRSTLVNSGRENDAESWIPMQDWFLKLRRMGKSVILVEHAGRSGDPRGTSKREDVLDCVLQLRRPDDYQTEEGARFEVHLTKARGISGEDAKPFEAKLEIRDGSAFWTTRELHDVEADRVRELTAEGMSVRDIAEETGLSKSRVNRIQTKLRAEGVV
jgi:hypothetical protein